LVGVDGRKRFIVPKPGSGKDWAKVWIERKRILRRRGESGWVERKGNIPLSGETKGRLEWAEIE